MSPLIHHVCFSFLKKKGRGTTVDDVCDAACATPKGERELGGTHPRISRSLREARPTSHPAALRVMPKPLSPGL